MIIKELTLHNFGVYASTNTFRFHGEKPIVLIGGMNGRGKTTFLEAVLLALYGSNSFAYIESKYNSFGQYLKSYVNTKDGTLESYVDLEFKLSLAEDELYRIHRAWNGGKKRVTERIAVYRDGTYNQFLTDNWNMFIENILPSGLSSFFFFDGEKIAELAVESTSKQMKESIKALLGITSLDLLKSDIGRIISRNAKTQVSNQETLALEKLRAERDDAAAKLDELDREVSELETQKVELTQKLEQKRQEYSIKGGDIVSQRNELFQQRSAVALKIDSIKEQLVTDAASEIPFVLVHNLLEKIREKSEIEQDNKLIEAAVKKIKLLSDEFMTAYDGDNEPVKKFIDYISSKTGENAEPLYSNLSDASLSRLQVLLNEQLQTTRKVISDKMLELKKSEAELDRLDSYMSVEINEKEIATIYRQIKELEQKIITVDVALSSKAEERKTLNGKAMMTNSVFNRSVEAYLKKAELNDDGDRIIKYSHMAESILDEYIVRLQKRKIGVVAETMTKCYRLLANKTSLIDHVEMDPSSLDLHYINENSEEVNKASLSAGEKQLMVIALLWALAICSKKKLPVIIDTPLSRLDSAHRVALIETYFPQASEQTIILSTDQEIDEKYYEIMKDNVGDEYTLNYSDSTKATTIQNGYFMGA